MMGFLLVEVLKPGERFLQFYLSKLERIRLGHRLSQGQEEAGILAGVGRISAAPV